MRRSAFTAIGLLCSQAVASNALAAPPDARDYFLTPPPKGRWLQTDLFTIGAQAAIEQRIPIVDGDVEMLTLRAHGMANVGFGELVLGADYRVLFLTVGGSLGTRQTWATYANPHGTLTRDDRNAMTGFSSSATTAEGRARLTIPLGPLFFITNHAVRWEDGPDGAFDWFNGNVHDGGTMYRADAALLLHSPRYGGIGPLVRYMDMPRLGFRKQELAGGIMAATRVGIFRHQDVMLLQVYTRPGDQEFGQHGIKMAAQIVLAYRAQFEL